MDKTNEKTCINIERQLPSFFIIILDTSMYIMYVMYSNYVLYGAVGRLNKYEHQHMILC